MSTFHDSFAILRELAEDNHLTAAQEKIIIALVESIQADAELRGNYERVKNRVMTLRTAAECFLKTDPPTMKPK